MTMTRTWTRWLVSALAVLALVLAGCGAEETEPETDDPGEAAEEDPAEDEEPDSAAEDGEPVSLRVGDIAGTPSAFLQFAVDQGFFEEQGLDVQVEVSPGGAANIPGVVAGEFEIAGSNAVSVLLARSQGLPLKMISAGTFASEDPEDDFSLLLVTPDSPIQEPSDLDGTAVAVNTLANIAELTIRASLENVGAGHESIEFVELGFPDMLPALQDGRVDAVHVIEPFMSIGLEQGMRPIIAPYAETQPGMAIGSYFSTDEYIEENPDVIDRFVAAVTAGGEYIEENPDEFRAALPDLADLEPEVAEMVNNPSWGGPVDSASVELIGELMERYDLFDETPPIDEVVYP